MVYRTDKNARVAFDWLSKRSGDNYKIWEEGYSIFALGEINWN